MRPTKVNLHYSINWINRWNYLFPDYAIAGVPTQVKEQVGHLTLRMSAINTASIILSEVYDEGTDM